MTEVQIRAQRVEDGQRVRAVLMAAFGRPEVPDLAEGLWSRTDGGAALVAEMAGEIVGAVQLSHSWVDAPRELVDVLVLSPLGVAPAVQGRGIGGELVRAALAAASDLAAPLVFLEGSPRYYPRFGFAAAVPLEFAKPSDRIPDAAFQVALLPRWQPWMTGRLVYNDVFWQYDCVGLR